MGLYDHYEASDTATVHILDDFWVEIYSPHHPKMRRFTEHQLRKYRSQLKGESIPLEVSRKMDLELCTAILKGWGGDGALDRDGSPLVFNPATVERVVAELDWFRQDLLTAYRSQMTFAKRELLAVGKGSSPSSEPTSGTGASEPDASSSAP